MKNERILFNSDTPSSYDHVFSNFTPHTVTFGGRTYKTVEHAFQSLKTVFPNEKAQVYNAPYPGQAKKAGRRVTLREDWEDIKYKVMVALVYLKFRRHDNIRKTLLATGEREIAEHAGRWNDRIWGLGRTMMGQNLLGKAIMEVRDLIRCDKEPDLTVLQ